MSGATTPAPPAIHHRAVEVTVTSSVAAELIARGGIKPRNPLCWECRDGRLTDDPRLALREALVSIAELDSNELTEGEIPAAPRIYDDVTVALTSTVAAELIAHAGIVPGSASCWRLPDRSQTTDPRTALTDALVVIAEA